MRELDDIARAVVDAAFRLHHDLGPGLLETVYEQVLAAQLERCGFEVVRQQSIDITYAGLHFEGAFRADLIIDGRLLVENKSVEQLVPVHAKQVITYLRLLEMPLGLLVNFGGATFKGNVRRIANGQMPLASLRLGERTTYSKDAG